MFKRYNVLERIPTDIIFEDRNFKKIWNRVITQQFFIKGIEKYGVYTRPTGYRKDGKVYLLGHKSSLDALDKLDAEEIEMDILDANIDIVLFLIIFLSKEHKNLRCTREYIRLILDYIETPVGKVWFSSVLKKGDREERLAHIMDASIYSIKCYLRLLRPGNEKFAEMLDTESLHYAITELEKEAERSGKRKPKDSGPKVTGDAGSKGSESTAAASTDDVTATSGSNSTPSESEDELPNDDADITEEEEDSEEFVKQQLEGYKDNGNQSAGASNVGRFVKKVCVTLSDDSQIELIGAITLTVDGDELKSTERLAKQPNGHWIVPNHRSFYLTVQPTI